MAYVYQRPGSKKWWAGFTMPDGGRKQFSTGLEDEASALQLALAYEKASQSAKQRRLNEATARRLLREIQVIGGIEATEVETVGAFLHRRRAAIGAQFKLSRTRERYQDAIDRFLKGHPQLEAQPLNCVTRRLAAEWRDRLQAVPLAAATVNHHLSTLRRQWDEAHTQGLVDENPWSLVRVKNARKQAQQRRPFSWAQFQAMLKATEAAAKGKGEALAHAREWHLFIKIAGYTGQRRNEVARMRAEHIDAQRRTLMVHRGKTNDWHEVPIHPQLWSDLQRHAGKQGLLLPKLAALPPTGRKSLSDIFRQKILPRIGIDQPYGEHKGRRLADYSIHSLRHSLSTWLNEAGVSDVDRMAIVGHADARVSQGYTHAQLEGAHRALQRLPEKEI